MVSYWLVQRQPTGSKWALVVSSWSWASRNPTSRGRCCCLLSVSLRCDSQPPQASPWNLGSSSLRCTISGSSQSSPRHRANSCEISTAHSGRTFLSAGRGPDGPPAAWPSASTPSPPPGQALCAPGSRCCSGDAESCRKRSEAGALGDSHHWTGTLLSSAKPLQYLGITDGLCCGIFSGYSDSFHSFTFLMINLVSIKEQISHEDKYDVSWYYGSWSSLKNSQHLSSLPTLSLSPRLSSALLSLHQPLLFSEAVPPSPPLFPFDLLKQAMAPTPLCMRVRLPSPPPQWGSLPSSLHGVNTPIN